MTRCNDCQAATALLIRCLYDRFWCRCPCWQAVKPALCSFCIGQSVLGFPDPESSLQVWKLPSLVLSLRLAGHKRGVWAAAFSPLEQIVATASGDKTLRLWSIKDGACLRTLQGHNASVLKLHYLGNGLQVPLPSMVKTPYLL